MVSKREMAGNVFRKLFSILIVLFAGTVLTFLILQKGRGQISDAYFLLYAVAGFFTFVFGVIAFISDFAVKHLKPDSLLAKSFFIFERSKLRPGSLFLPIPITIAIVISVLIMILVASSDTAIFAPPNPYTQSMELAAESYAQHGTLSNLFNGAIVPGLFEEGLVFFGIQMTTFIVLLSIYLGTGRKDEASDHPLVFWIVTLAWCGVYALAFSLGHGRYGGNSEAYAFAFFFEFVMQFLNQLTGSFISWLPHIVHNSTVIVNKAFSFVTFAIVPFIPVRWLYEE